MRQIMCAAAAALMVVTLGCSPRDRRETASTLDSTATDLGRDIEQGAEEARDEVGNYTYDQRTEFRRDVDLKLKQLDEQIAELERTTKRGVDKARDSALVDVREARKAVSQRLSQFAGATEAGWENAKQDVTAAVDSLHRKVKYLLPDARPMGGTGPG